MPALIWSTQGWNGSGNRISIKATRAIINAILNGDLEKATFTTIPFFDLSIPDVLEGVDGNILDPRNTYTDPTEWVRKARSLAALFIDNFRKYEDADEDKSLAAAGPVL